MPAPAALPGTRRKATTSDLGSGFADVLQEVLAPLPTAVERFARWHEAAPSGERSFVDLIPLSSPKPGEQYAFEVDLDRCSSCKACVAACHSLNGLGEQESWRSVGTATATATAQTVTVTGSCHHCEDPGCASGCPVLAYEKDEKTGIVKHLDDQCIGCQYCLWTCPYDAPKFQPDLGIVRKCDMCHSRLAVGEAPACVQSCPSSAIRITLVGRDTGKANAAFSLPGTVPPERTGPTTRYLSSRDLSPSLAGPETSAPGPEHAHMPLATLLVLTQWSLGIWTIEMLGRLIGLGIHQAALPIAATLLLAGLGIGSLHLGRPRHAWKIFLGWRRSWFSREAILLGAAAKFAILSILPPPFLASLGFPAPLVPLLTILPWIALASLLGGVACSTMLYIATPRPVWSRPATALRFGLTALGGGAVVIATLGGDGIRIAGALSILTGIMKATLVLRDRKPAPDAHPSFLVQARLLAGPLKTQALSQLALFLFAVGLAVLGTALAYWPLFLVAIAFRFGSDLVERRLFFMACPATRMPGMRAAGH